MKKLIVAFISINSLLLSPLRAIADEAANYDLHAAYALTGFASTFGTAVKVVPCTKGCAIERLSKKIPT